MCNTLETDGVIVQFGQHRVLSDVYLKCQTGEAVGLLGRNGSGKSTLLRILYGDLRVPNRSVRVNGKLVDEPFKDETIRFLPQQNFIPKAISVKQAFQNFNVGFDNFLELFPDFEKVRNSQLNNLSGGERRIIEIFLILKSKAMFCLLDEPFSHIMPVHVEQIKSLIQTESKNKGILIVDHLYEHIIELSNKTYLIAHGKTHLLKEPDDIKMLGYIL